MEKTIPVNINNFEIDQLEYLFDKLTIRNLKLEKILCKENIRHRCLTHILSETPITFNLSIRNIPLYGRIYNANLGYDISIHTISHTINEIHYKFDMYLEQISIESIRIKTMDTGQGKVLSEIINGGYCVIGKPIITPTRLVGFDVLTSL